MRVVASFLLALGAACAAAQPVEVLPFVDASGLVTAAPTHSDLVRALGEPPVAKVLPETWESVTTRSGVNRSHSRDVKRGGQLDLAYPARGLSFRIEREQRPLADPPIGSMTVERPATARTPQGLWPGMPEADAVALARSHYRVLHEQPSPDGLTMQLGDARGASRHTLWLQTRAGVLHRLQFDLQPGLPAWARWAVAGAAVAAAGAAAAFVTWLRRRVVVRWPTLAPATLRTVDRVILAGGVLVVLGALATAVLAWQALLSGNAYGVMGGLVMAGYALGALAVGAFVVVLALRAR